MREPLHRAHTPQGLGLKPEPMVFFQSPSKGCALEASGVRC